MKKEEFEKFVEEALLDIPEKFINKLKNKISVIVEDYPNKEVYTRTGTHPSHHILGLYHGVPLKHRGPYYGNVAPDVISIYQKPIESICSNKKEVKEKIREVIIHEIAHFFGFKDDYLYKLEHNRNKGR